MGAIINPYKFLQYATAAAAVSSIVLQKVHSLLAIRGAFSAQIDKIITEARAKSVDLLKNFVGDVNHSLSDKVKSMSVVDSMFERL